MSSPMSSPMSSRAPLALVTAALGVLALLAPTSAARPTGAPAPVRLQVEGVLETVAVEGGPGLDTVLVLDDGTRVPVVRTDGMPVSGGVSATVTVPKADGEIPVSAADAKLDALGGVGALLRW